MQKHFGCQACQPGGCNGGMWSTNEYSKSWEGQPPGTNSSQERERERGLYLSAISYFYNTLIRFNNNHILWHKFTNSLICIIICTVYSAASACMGWRIFSACQCSRVARNISRGAWCSWPCHGSSDEVGTCLLSSHSWGIFLQIGGIAFQLLSVWSGKENEGVIFTKICRQMSGLFSFPSQLPWRLGMPI